MRVILSAGLLVPEHILSLTTLLTEAAKGRHLVLCDEPEALDTWLGRQGELGACLREALDAAARQELRAGPEQLTLYLVAGESDWDRGYPRVTAADGFALCAEPVDVWVEDNVNDRAFLLWLAGDELSARLQWLEREKWLVFAHGGGSSGLLTRVAAHCRRVAGQRLSFVLVDSDALEQGEETGKKQRGVVRDLRGLLGERVWCLRRRMMENYLPREALWLAVEEGLISSAFVEALEGLGDRARWVNLKKGLEGDTKRLFAEGHPDPFADLDPQRRAALARGREDIGKLWLRPEARRWQPDPDASAEAAPHLHRLASLL